MVHVSRRWLGAASLAALLAPCAAFADTPLDQTLDGIATSFAAATKLTASIALRVAGLQPSGMKSGERAKVAADIASFDDALTQMAMSQRIIMGDIGDYVSSVRARGYKQGEHDKMWRWILTDLRELSAKVDIVREQQQKATWLADALTPEEEQAFGDTLTTRALLIDRLSSLPAPRTVIEINKLGALHARYLELIKELAGLRQALADARRRFV